MTIDFFCTLTDSYALHVCEIFWTGAAITTDQSRVVTKRHGSACKRASQETSSYSNFYCVVSRSVIDWTTFFGKIRTEFAAREKSPGLFPGKSPF